MLLSYPLEALRCDVETAFSELILGCRYATELPNQDRLNKFLSKTKDLDKNHKLPDKWIYIQFKRNALEFGEDQDLFRSFEIVNSNPTLYGEKIIRKDEWGYGQTTLEFWMVANNGETIELAEALFYCRIFNVRLVNYSYLNLKIKSRVVHEQLQSYDPMEVNDVGTLWTVTWRATLYVPILLKESQVFKIKEVDTSIKLYRHDDDPFSDGTEVSQ